jgi:hypothetical protein
MTCKLWDGPTIETHGIVYGRLPGRKMVLAHRAAYEECHGPIPDNLVIDHLCRNGLCVNPIHLEAVTNVINIMRGDGAPAKNARKTHCHKGHEFTKENTHTSPQNRRICKTCRAERDALARAKRRAADKASGYSQK